MNLTKIENALEEERRRLMTQVQHIEGALYALANMRYGGKRLGGVSGKRRRLSKEARARISAAQKARWRKWKKENK
jgi:hypothetical protein